MFEDFYQTRRRPASLVYIMEFRQSVFLSHAFSEAAFYPGDYHFSLLKLGWIGLDWIANT